MGIKEAEGGVRKLTGALLNSMASKSLTADVLDMFRKAKSESCRSSEIVETGFWKEVKDVGLIVKL